MCTFNVLYLKLQEDGYLARYIKINGTALHEITSTESVMHEIKCFLCVCMFNSVTVKLDK